MGTNAVARWLADLLPNATMWEVAAALVGIVAVGYALWGAVDNVADIVTVRREAIDGDPRGIAAWFLLAANALFLASWLGYTHVATVAVYLPARPDMPPGALTDVTVMRLGYAVFNLLGLAVLREMRNRLRNLPREQWGAVFGDQERYHASQAALRRVEAEFATYRAETHDAKNETVRWRMRAELMVRLLRQHGVEPPPMLAPAEGES